MNRIILLIVFLAPFYVYAQQPKRVTQNDSLYDVEFMLKNRRKIDKSRLIQVGGHYIDSLFNKRMAYEDYRSFSKKDSIQIIISFKEKPTRFITSSVIRMLTQKELANADVSTEIPKSPVNKTVSLELDLKDTIQFYRNVKNMQNVQTLTLRSADGVIPNSVGDLSNLQVLVVGHNKSSIIPASIGKLKYLKTLSIGKGIADKLPESIGNLSNLTELTINDNSGLHSLPKNITKLTNLEVLDLSFNGLTKIPSEIYKWKKLKILILAGNHLTKIPKEIGQITTLEALYLDQNLIDSLPPEIGNLKNLKILSATQNKIRYIPDEICNLINLNSLFLNDNKISTIPERFGNMKSLKTIYLQNNKLLKVPASIAKLDSLEELFLSNNRLSNIPEEFTKMKSLKLLTITGNMISSFPKFPDRIKVGGDY